MLVLGHRVLTFINNKFFKFNFKFTDALNVLLVYLESIKKISVPYKSFFSVKLNLPYVCKLLNSYRLYSEYYIHECTLKIKLQDLTNNMVPYMHRDGTV